MIRVATNPVSWLLFIVIVVRFVVDTGVMSRLRHYHPHEWALVGEPTFWKYYSIRDGRSARTFISRNQHLQLADARLNVLITTSRALLWAGLAILGLDLVLSFLVARP
jgi:hypothetical protein